MSLGVTRERYNIITSRYADFLKILDKDVPPVRVFDPLTKKQIGELELIRDISKYLQEKKDDDIAAANKAETEEVVEKPKAEVVEEVKEKEASN
ncbi:uncharacterized protein LOC123704390 [Colias croceus]|uniref:uncharacterized protein LOC123704390 n=1 Tax=Colias crocea TaxID=72248 RepID=UPI001E281545|nr:uncharacterized protein LOC123704390 [Colias croceus]